MRDNPSLLDSTDIPESPAELKAQLYALSAFVLEQVFPDVERWLMHNPNRLPGKSDLVVEDGVPALFLNSSSTLEWLKENPFAQIVHLMNSTSFGSVVAAQMKMKAEKPGLHPTFMRTHRRMRLLLSSKKYEKFDAGKETDPDKFPPIFVARGANTGYRAAWDMAVALPLVWREQFGQDMTQEEFEAIIRNSHPTASILASMHLDDLGPFFHFLQKRFKNPFRVSFDAPHFPPHAFIVIPFKDSYTLKIKPELISEWKSEVGHTKEGPYVRHGCPARDAKMGEHDKRSIIDFTMDYVSGIASRTIFPNCTLFVDQALEDITPN
jgi:hypothetical protein